MKDEYYNNDLYRGKTEEQINWQDDFRIYFKAISENEYSIPIFLQEEIIKKIDLLLKEQLRIISNPVLYDADIMILNENIYINIEDIKNWIRSEEHTSELQSR